MTVRADNPGFQAATGGSSRPIDLYPGRNCVGKPHSGPPAKGNSVAFHFFSYVVRA